MLDGATIIEYLHEVAEELPDGIQETIVIVGGSMLAIIGLRDATKDVDTARRYGSELAAAAARVARRHDLNPGWLNSEGAAWAPDGDIVSLIDDTPPVLDLPALRVHTASADAVFVMKVHASRPHDHPDIVALWPLCSFESFDAAADACNRAYEHLVDPDPYLAQHIETIVLGAG